MKITRNTLWKIVIAGVLAGGLLVATGMHKRIYSSARSRMIRAGIITPGTVKPDEFENLKLEPDTALAFQLLDEKGQIHSLSEFSENTVFFNKWATWCAPCVAEMPSIHQLFMDTRGNVRFLMVTWDTDFEKAKLFKKKHGYTFPIYQVYGFLPETFKTPSIPATFIIPKKQLEMYRYVGMLNYDTPEFRDFLKQLDTP